jgi:predicted O-methyltransferase YrrM
MKFPEILKKTNHVNALLCNEDKRALCEYSALVEDGGVIVDIGTAAGGSAFIMGLSSKPNVKIYTIDPMINRDFEENRLALGLGNKVEFINRTSSDAFSTWDKQIDMLFIDGVHNYQGVMNDFKTFGSKVKKGGIVVFHDVFLYDNTIGVAVNEIINHGWVNVLMVVKDYWNDGRLIGMMVTTKT